MLGDSYGERRNSSTFFVLQQEDSNVSYLMWFHKLVASLGYCRLTKPKLETRIGKDGRIRHFYRVRTFCFSSFNWIHKLFYPNGVKVVPANIGDFLTPLALALALAIQGTGWPSRIGLLFGLWMMVLVSHTD
uniref:LAGLIDADG endonuclease n=1 Tax=Spizellomyces sp. 'palustris' TaxID=117820 RepID=UPI0010FBCF5B|nr:LAGLIDADG endonuclease [Spizellomyces sp. 'palustris']QCQ69056.1 LAGLIDADG endonuclease [Spizellomyces sp. 'palustris']